VVDHVVDQPGSPGGHAADQFVDQLDTWLTRVDEESDDDHRFSWSMACLQDLENGNEYDSQSSVKPIDGDDQQTLDELINPSSTALCS